MFRLPPEIIAGIAAYKEQLRSYLEGRLSPGRFKSIRVPWGIYSQRHGLAHMCRVRIPGGLLSADQMRAIADVARKYGDGSLHVTTRQDIQIHGVKIEDTGRILDYLKDFDLSPRGGGGNTVRNILACPRAGVCPQEAFDVRPYAVGLSEYILSLDSSYLLPRKYKIAFSGCSLNCVPATVSDLGFIARQALVGGEQQDVFRVYVGGGMGAHSRVGRVLEDLVEPADAGYVAEAVKRAFDRHGNRRNRHRNRLRFLIEEAGFEQFKRWYREELAELKTGEVIALRKIAFPGPAKGGGSWVGDSDDFKAWRRFNLREQKQKGYYSLEARLPLGLISPDQLGGLAELSSAGEQITFRTTPDQNILITDVPGPAVPMIYHRLRELKLDQPDAATILDPVCCPGAATCNLGLCNSRGAAAEIVERLEEAKINIGSFAGVRVKINGCPNACAHHPIGEIGLHGLVRKEGSRPVPYYSVWVGGDQREESTRLGEELGVVPARNLPGVLQEFVRRAAGAVSHYGDFHEYLEKEGKIELKSLIEERAHVPSYETDPLFYRDWGKEEDFTLAGLGPGECGAGIVDLIEEDFIQAGRLLKEAVAGGYPPEPIRQSIYLSARALLVLRGLEPKTGGEAIDLFRKELVEKGFCSPRFSGLRTIWEGGGGSRTEEACRYAEELLDEVKLTYREMDDHFNLKVRYGPSGEPREEDTARTVLDLRGVACPLNYVKAKLYLETREVGDEVTMYLDEGEPIRNVPPSLKNDGQEIVSIEPVAAGYYRVTVIKK